MKRPVFLVLMLLSACLSYGQEDSSLYQWGNSSASYNIRFFKTHCNDREYAIAGYYVLKNSHDGWGSTQLLEICSIILQRAQTSVDPSLEHGYSQIYNLAADKISKIYEARNRYDSALHYLCISDTVHRYVTSCGNDYYMHRIINACRYADIYEKINDTDRAFTILLKEAFNTETNRHFIKLQPLLSRYERKKLKRELNYSILHYVSDSFARTTGHNGPYIVFLVTKIYFYAWSVNETANSIALKKKTIAYLKNTPFYTMVMRM